MNLGPFGLEPHWWWLIGGAVLGIAELLAPGIFLIWLAAAAVVTGLAALLFGFSLAFQFAIFTLMAISAVMVGRRWYVDHPVESSDPLLNDRTARLIGQTVIVVDPIENGAGRVKVGDSVWAARGEDAAIGCKVRIIRAEGTCLYVEPVVIPNSRHIG